MDKKLYVKELIENNSLNETALALEILKPQIPPETQDRDFIFNQDRYISMGELPILDTLKEFESSYDKPFEAILYLHDTKGLSEYLLNSGLVSFFDEKTTLKGNPLVIFDDLVSFSSYINLDIDKIEPNRFFEELCFFNLPSYRNYYWKNYPSNKPNEILDLYKENLLNKHLVFPRYTRLRNEITEIESTRYATHKLYQYPASFIPQVIKYCIKDLPKGSLVLDPFGGGGTVALESNINGLNSVVIDINPLIARLVKLKRTFKINEEVFKAEFETLFNLDHDNHFYTLWKDLPKWYDPNILDIISKVAYNIHQTKEYKDLFLFAFLPISRKYSLADEKTHKLCTSQDKKARMADLLKREWKLELEYELKEKILKYKEAILELGNIAGENIDNTYSHVYDNSDSFSLDLDYKYDAIVTSPPYLQAQEYTRTVKMDIYWMGYDESVVKTMASREIPYRKIDDGVEIPNELYKEIKSKIPNLDKDIDKMFRSYFYYMMGVLDRHGDNLKVGGKFYIFVGSPKTRGVEIPIWEIIMDYFVREKGGYKIEEIIADEIVSRKLAKNRKGENPEGMQYEYLIILKKVV
jgi:DNA modification methylase